MGTTARTDNRRDILVSACERNVAVEMHQFGTAEELFVARSRLLDIDEKCIYLDKPESQSKSLSLNPDRDVRVYLQFAGKRYTFRASVVHRVCEVRLNATTKVRGMALRRPRQCEEGQRRENYRVCVLHSDTIDVHFHTLMEGDVDRCPLDATRFRGQLIDLSRAGMRVCVDAEEHKGLKRGDRYFVHCRLPGDDAEITMLAEIRYAHEIVRGEVTRLGLRFVPWFPEFTRPQYQAIAQFCIELQRRNIRRAR